MKILIVTQYFWPETFRINDLALGLREKGHEISVLTGKPNYPQGSFFPGYSFVGQAKEVHEGITIHRVPVVSRGRNSRLRLILNYASFAISAALLGPLRCRDRYDLIFVYEPSPITVGIPAIVMKKIKKAPIFLWVQDLWPDAVSAAGAVRSRFALKLLERLVRFVYRHCDCILGQSQAFSSHIRALGVEDSRIRYFPNSADELYRPVAAEKAIAERQLMPEGFRVMFAGNIGVIQDFPTILEAADRLRPYSDIHWIIVGDGREAEVVKAAVASRGLTNVHLLGQHPAERMPQFFAVADALLLTLRKQPSCALTIPSKLQSYLACGRPIVAGLDGEGARVVRESCAGFAAGAGDPAGLAEAVLAMYRLSKEAREQMGQRARQYFEQHFERNKLLDILDGWTREFAHRGAQ